MSEFEPYGDDWKKEMMKMSKPELIAMLKKEFSNQRVCAIDSVNFGDNTVTFTIPDRHRRARWGAGILRVNFKDVIHDY